MSITENRYDLDERVRADMSVALERACNTLPPDLDSYEARKFIAQHLDTLVESGEVRLSELTAGARRALAELNAR